MRLHMHEWGSSGRPVVVLLHGVGNSSSTWWRVAPALAAEGWQVVALDLRGHGRSPRAGWPFTAAGLGSDVLETLTALRLERVAALWGHSLGALTALAALDLDPDCAQRVVLEDPPGSSDPKLFDEVAADVRQGCALARAQPDRAVAETLEENPSWSVEEAERAVASRRRCDVEPVVASLRRGLDYELLPLAKRLRARSFLLLAREADSPLHGIERKQVAATCDEEMAFDSGHTVHIDRFEECLGAVTRWLAGQGAAPTGRGVSGLSG